MKKVLLAAFAFFAVLAAVTADDMIYRPKRQKHDLLLRQDAPAKDWESQYLPQNMPYSARKPSPRGAVPSRVSPVNTLRGRR